MVCSDGKWVDDGSGKAMGYPVADTDCGGTWGHSKTDKGGIDITNQKFFDFEDVKPGDWGENTISIHVNNNDAYGMAIITAIENRENGCTEPERIVENESNQPYPCIGQWCGELAQNTEVRVWVDNGLNANGDPISGATPGDNIYQPGEVLLTNPSGDGWRTLYPDAESMCDQSQGAVNYTPNSGDVMAKIPLGVPVPGKDYGYLTGGQDYYYGVEWKVPGSVNNIIQGDSMKADIQFEIEQARHNTTPFIN